MSKEAMRQALDALLGIHTAKLADGTYADKDCKISSAIAALRAQLAKDAEPVAWGMLNTAITGSGPTLMMVHVDIPSNDQYGGRFWVPLFLSPPDYAAGRNDGLEQAAKWLDEAADEIEAWGDYASDYFKEKHDLEDSVKTTRDRAASLRALKEE